MAAVPPQAPDRPDDRDLAARVQAEPLREKVQGKEGEEMMDDIQDELITPGCPQCAVKHLSAALMYRAREQERLHDARELIVSRVHVLVARAYINLGEVLVGYRSHLWYAVGLLQAAEEVDLAYAGNVWPSIRSARLMLTWGEGDESVRKAMVLIDCALPFNFVELETAHCEEAHRELPCWNWPRSADYAAMIAAIREEFCVEASAASTEDAGKGGETDMATKKAPAKKAPAKKAPAFLKKADPKAAKAAAKGGCTKKCKK